jgi:hypothetical protein
LAAEWAMANGTLLNMACLRPRRIPVVWPFSGTKACRLQRKSRREMNRGGFLVLSLGLAQTQRFQRRLVDRFGGVKALGALVFREGLTGQRAEETIDFAFVKALLL